MGDRRSYGWFLERCPAAPTSLFLAARPSFLAGASSVFDLFGVFKEYNRSASPEEADVRAIRADWLVTGQDLWTALHQAAAAGRPDQPEGQEQLFDPGTLPLR